MPKMSRQEKSQYEVIDSGEACYFCGDVGTMHDYTPAAAASQQVKDTFPEQKTAVLCCSKDWRRIYSANVADGAVKYGVPRGAMTLDQKRHLLGFGGSASEVPKSSFTVGFEPAIITRTDTLAIDEGKFLWNGHTMYRDEMMALQGPMALRMLNMSQNIIEVAILQGLNSGELDETKIEIYREMVDVDSAKKVIDVADTPY